MSSPLNNYSRCFILHLLGGSIPVTLTLQEATGKNVLLLPMGACDDGAHSQNEKSNIRNYIEGTKLLGAYIYELGQMK